MFWEFEDGLTNTITGATESAFYVAMRELIGRS
jgi:hypothetical protein